MCEFPPRFYVIGAEVGLKQLLTKLQAFEADMLERPKNGGKYRESAGRRRDHEYGACLNASK